MNFLIQAITDWMWGIPAVTPHKTTTHEDNENLKGWL
tara:strand:+ start:4190 stop:4300 length:111 start_codon:yes stop_codon:yes gene_type:complete